ncbi:MAG: DsbA family protein [Beijerinckiaceae bacterium]|jgi:putative protein-disulfide isomerase|nr:DsbA family protein [Beijerinckiaceae bacterium]
MESETIDRPRLLYFADTMCSWCYGFAPEMQRVLERFHPELDLLAFSGGLRPFNTEPVSDSMRAMLTETYGRIGQLTGQPFGTCPSLTPGFVYDSEPASRAVVTMRNMAPGDDYAFMLAIQRAFYAEGEDITRPDVLARHAATFGVPEEAFLETFSSEAIRQATMADFQVAQQFGIDGFPTLILHRQRSTGDNALMMVSQGYAKADDVIERLRAALDAEIG